MTKHCGIFGLSMLLVTGACATEVEFDGGPDELAAGQGRTFALAPVGDELFWSGETGVWRRSFDSDAIVAVDDRGPTLALAVGGDRLYWATADEIVTADARGDDREVIATDQRCVFAMAADDRRVFWASLVDGQVWSWDSVTGERALLADRQGNPTGMAVAGGQVYWSTGAGTVASVPVGGGDMHVLVDDGTWKSSVAIAGSEVVWIDWDATVGAMGYDGGGVRRVRSASAVGSFASALAADEDAVYWLRAADRPDGTGTVLGAAAVGDEPAVVARANATAVTVGDDAVYWATDDGAIYARARR